MGPPFVALVLMAGSHAGASGCSKGSPAVQAEALTPPATSSAVGAAASSAAPLASSAPPAPTAPGDGGFGVAMRPHEHMFLADYRSTLRTWMTLEEQARAAAVDTSRTDRGSVAKLALLEADCAVRVISPLALEVRGFHDEAKALRGLAPIVDRRTAAAAAATLEPIERRAEPPEIAVRTGPLGVEKPLSWSMIALTLVQQGSAAPPFGAVAAMGGGGAVREGAVRAPVVDAEIDLLRAMAAAARAGTR